jgi:hypothetical protein
MGDVILLIFGQSWILLPWDANAMFRSPKDVPRAVPTSPLCRPLIQARVPTVPLFLLVGFDMEEASSPRETRSATQNIGNRVGFQHFGPPTTRNNVGTGLGTSHLSPVR